MGRPSTHSRALGAIWGTCVGDALGGPIQFRNPGTFQPITELEFVKPFKQPSGYDVSLCPVLIFDADSDSSYSDDGSMTLALAQSFVDSNGQYNHALSIQYYLDWFNHGRFSTTDKAWDLGRSTRLALRRWKSEGLGDLPLAQQKVTEQLDYEGASGNGSLMRISPIGVALWTDCARAKTLAREQSLVTHPALACPDACEAYTELICMAMSGMPPHLAQPQPGR